MSLRLLVLLIWIRGFSWGSQKLSLSEGSEELRDSAGNQETLSIAEILRDGNLPPVPAPKEPQRARKTVSLEVRPISAWNQHLDYHQNVVAASKLTKGGGSQEKVTRDKTHDTSLTEKTPKSEIITLINACRHFALQSPRSPREPQDWVRQQSFLLKLAKWPLLIETCQKDIEIANALVNMLMDRIQGRRETLTHTIVALRDHTYKLVESVVSVSDPSSILFKVISTAGLHLNLLQTVEMLPHSRHTEEEVAKIEGLLLLIFKHHELLQLDLVDRIKTTLVPLSPRSSWIRDRHEAETWLEKTKIRFTLGRLLIKLRNPKANSPRSSSIMDNVFRNPREQHPSPNQGLQSVFEDLFLSNILPLFASDFFDIFEDLFKNCYACFALSGSNPNTLNLAHYKLLHEHSHWRWLPKISSTSSENHYADKSRLAFLLRVYNNGGLARTHWTELFKQVFALLERVPLSKVGDDDVLAALTDPSLISIFSGSKALQRNADWPGFAKCLFTIARSMGRWASRMINQRASVGQRSAEDSFPGERVVVKLLGVWKPCLETLKEVGAFAGALDPYGTYRVPNRITKVIKVWQKVETQLEQLQIHLPKDLKSVSSYSDLSSLKKSPLSKAESEIELLTELAGVTKPAWLMHLDVRSRLVQATSPSPAFKVVVPKNSSPASKVAARAYPSPASKVGTRANPSPAPKVAAGKTSSQSSLSKKVLEQRSLESVYINSLLDPEMIAGLSLADVAYALDNFQILPATPRSKETTPRKNESLMSSVSKSATPRSKEPTPRKNESLMSSVSKSATPRSKEPTPRKNESLIASASPIVKLKAPSSKSSSPSSGKVTPHSGGEHHSLRFINVGVPEESREGGDKPPRRRSQQSTRSKAGSRHGVAEMPVLELNFDKMLENLAKQSVDPSKKGKSSGEKKVHSKKAKSSSTGKGGRVKKTVSEPRDISPITTLPAAGKETKPKISPRLHRTKENVDDKKTEEKNDVEQQQATTESKKHRSRHHGHKESKEGTESKRTKSRTEPSVPSPQDLDSPHAPAGDKQAKSQSPSSNN